MSSHKIGYFVLRRLCWPLIVAAALSAILLAGCTPVTQKLGGGSQLTHQVTTATEYYTSGPEQGSPPDGTFQAGTKVAVLQWAGSYAQVRTADGIEAYVASEALAPLATPTP